MKTDTLATVPMILQEYTLTAFNSAKARRQQTGVVKLLPPVPEPDEKTVRDLNTLASKHPFCVSQKFKKHDPL